MPAGTLESKDRDPSDAVRRELVEEAGYRSREVRFLFGFRPAPGTSTEYMHVFMCSGLSSVERRPEPFEDLQVHAVDLQDALAMVGDGTITDGKTIAALLWYARFEGPQ